MEHARRKCTKKSKEKCEKRKRNFTLEMLKLIDPESTEVNPVVDSVIFCLSFLGTFGLGIGLDDGIGLTVGLAVGLLV